MSRKNTHTKNKHLSFDDRLTIQEALKVGSTFKAVARHLGKDPTTISREIKRNITIVHTSHQRKDKKGNPIIEVCPLLLKAPFCCNPCKKLSSVCIYDKHKYFAKEAQKKYELTLKDSREGIPLNKQCFYDLDALISDRVKHGQKIYHIITSNKLPVSQTSVYRHIKKGYMSISPTELSRMAKFKARKAKKQEYIPKGLKTGRSFVDFEEFISKQNIDVWVEMDTLIGRIGGKTIITFHFVGTDFMFGLLSEDKSAASTTALIQSLKKQLCGNGITFGTIFATILTDNGGEFANIFAIENNLDNLPETKLFFCNPYCSSQKPHVERNHSHFRDILSTGSTFDDLTQKDVNLIFSHINSGCRPKFNGKSPYQMFAFTYGEHLAKLLGIEPIAPENVVQNSKLLIQIRK
jgi:IS30 family transposase